MFERFVEGTGQTVLSLADQSQNRIRIGFTNAREAGDLRFSLH